MIDRKKTETWEKDSVVFRYDRGKRLEKAGPDARWLNERRGKKSPGILKSLTSTGPMRALFYTILLAAVSLGVIGFITNPVSSGELAGNRFSVDALWFQGSVYVSVARSTPAVDTPSAQVELRVSVDTGDTAPVVVEHVLAAGEGEFRTAVKSGSKPKFAAVSLESGGKTIELAAAVK